MIYVWAAVLAIVNLLLWLLNLLGLPGNWLMIVAATLLAWWQWDLHKSAGEQMFSAATLVIVLGLAAAGEVLEFLAGVLGAKAAGGTRRATWGALLGGLIGGVVGTVAIPIPVLGTLIGACGGAALGATVMELSGGRRVRPSVKAGVSAGLGRFLGTFAKMGLGAMIWLIITIASFWP